LTTATSNDAARAIQDYEKALKLYSREEWDTDQELLEDGARTNPYATWEYGMALRLSGKFQEATDIHKLASQYFEDIGDPARAVISLIDAGIDASDYNVDKARDLIKTALGGIKLVEGRDIPLLQRVIAKEGEARMALASIYWTTGERQEAESQLGLACQRLDQLEADAIARNKVNPKVIPPRLKFNIDDGVGALDISCSKLKNKEYLSTRLEWPESLQAKANKLYSLRK
jgi:tetratricopeptide (TPR) repeat protein